MLLPETLIWAGLLGSLFTVSVFITVRIAMAPRSVGAWRQLFYVLLISSVLSIHSNLLQELWPTPRTRAFQAWAQIFAGPLTAGVALRYLGKWMGGLRSDRVLRYSTQWTGSLLIACAAVLALLGLRQEQQTLEQWLWPVAAITLLGASMGVVGSLRGVVLGDRLARWMLAACIMLVLTTAGLYVYSLRLLDAGTLLAVLISLTALGFLVLATVLVDQRNRETRRLARLAAADFSVEPATGLPIGASFVSQLEHEFWRVRRRNGQCAVLCVYLHNLDEVGRALGPSAEYKVQVAMAARITRAAGFRCTVGLYHPQCFVVVIQMGRHGRLSDPVQERLHTLACEPMTVHQVDGSAFIFEPQGSLAMTLTDADAESALEVLNATEAAAQRASLLVPQSQIDTEPGPLTGHAPMDGVAHP